MFTKTNKTNGRRLLVAALAVMGLSAVAHAQPVVLATYVDLNDNFNTIIIDDGDVIALDDSEIGDKVVYQFNIEDQGDQTLVVDAVDASARSNNVDILDAGFNVFPFGVKYPATVVFDVAASGRAVVVVTIESNDPATPSFAFTLTTDVIAPPEIQVTYLDANDELAKSKLINRDDEIDLGTFEVDDEVRFDFDILNAGGGTLALSDLTAESVSPNVANPTADFETVVLNQFAAYAQWVLTEAGEFEVEVNISSNTSDKQDFRFRLTGLVQEREVEIVDCNSNGIDDAEELDTDLDGYIDDCDNCPELSNPDQLDSDGNGLGDACEVEEEEPVVCTDEYLPVCGMDGMTYDNACSADEAGMPIAYEGSCTPPEDDEVVCTDDYEPVCGMNGMTYGNACYADQADTSVAYEGACEVLTPPGDDDGLIGDDGKIGDDGENPIDDPEPGQEEGNAGGGSAGMCGAGGLGMLPLIVLGLCGLKLGATGRSRRSFTTVTR